ncbi:MAG TPA: extracellular solute-binding protein [Ktedonobacteraceae bacterium]|nr:extracellular solute-binding protein [Ktedonobacteraceae bacterium]
MMPLFDRQQRKQVDQLVTDFSQHKLGRREFMQRALAVGLSASAATALLAACGGGNTIGGNSPNTNSGPTQSSTVDLLNVWSGEEKDSFDAVVAPFTAQNKITINAESTRDLSAVLTTRIRGNNAPDMAVLPNPGFMQQLASQGKLIPLDSFLDMDKIKQDYSQGWLDLGSYNGHLYALFYKAANKGTIWYNPKNFSAAGYQTPATWNDLIALSDKIAQSGKYPWSMGLSSAAASGWPAADWIAQIYLNQNGGDMYDKWVNHQIPWTDPSIKAAFQAFGQIANGKHYINGAPQSIIATGYQDASYLPFKNPPAAYMYYLGDFTEGFITGQFKSAVAGTDFNFFPFPTINQSYAGAVTGGADVVVALKNTTAVQALVKYMATAQAQEIWVKRGGFTSPNKSVDLASYPDAVAKASAQQLTQATIFRFGADDLMPQAVENAFWKATLQYVQSPDQLDSILQSMESTAAQSYTS